MKKIFVYRLTYDFSKFLIQKEEFTFLVIKETQDKYYACLEKASNNQYRDIITFSKDDACHLNKYIQTIQLENGETVIEAGFLYEEKNDKYYDSNGNEILWSDLSFMIASLKIEIKNYIKEDLITLVKKVNQMQTDYTSFDATPTKFKVIF